MGFRGLRLVGLGCPGCARRIRQKDEAIGKAVAWIEEADGHRSVSGGQGFLDSLIADITGVSNF